MGYIVRGILQTRILEWVASFSLLQGIFPAQELNPGLLRCRWILYQVEERSPISQRNSSAPGLPGATLLPSAPVPAPPAPILTQAAFPRQPSPLKPHHAHRLRDMSLDAQFCLAWPSSHGWVEVTLISAARHHLCPGDDPVSSSLLGHGSWQASAPPPNTPTLPWPAVPCWASEFQD